MKQRLTKVLAVLALTVSVLGLTACGSAASAENGISYDENYLHSVADFLIANWEGMPAEDIAGYATMDDRGVYHCVCQL